MTPLIRNAVTLSRCQVARSSRTTTAILVGKSVTPIAAMMAPHGSGVLNEVALCRRVARGRDPDMTAERAREVRLVREPTAQRHLGGRVAGAEQRAGAL